MGKPVKESECRSSTYTSEHVDERLMAMRLEMTAFEPAEVSETKTKQEFGDSLTNY